jgi:hypothetical protein
VDIPNDPRFYMGTLSSIILGTAIKKIPQAIPYIILPDIKHHTF